MSSSIIRRFEASDVMTMSGQSDVLALHSGKLQGHVVKACVRDFSPALTLKNGGTDDHKVLINKLQVFCFGEIQT